MQYNRDMIALHKEAKLFKRAEKSAVARLVLLMNEFHSCDLKYFPTEQDRRNRKEGIEQGLRQVTGQLPSSLKGMVSIWMKDAQAWRDAIDTIHF